MIELTVLELEKVKVQDVEVEKIKGEYRMAIAPDSITIIEPYNDSAFCRIHCSGYWFLIKQSYSEMVQLRDRHSFQESAKRHMDGENE